MGDILCQVLYGELYDIHIYSSPKKYCEQTIRNDLRSREESHENPQDFGFVGLRQLMRNLL